MRLATVVAPGTFPTAIYDGDTVAIAMTSMIGAVYAGQRVWVMQVPPSGNYIAGTVSEDPALWTASHVVTAATEASITFTIPSWVRVLEIDFEARCDFAANSIRLSARINSDSATQYIWRNWALSGATGTAGSHNYLFADTSGYAGVISGSTASAIRFGSGRITVQGWNSPAGKTLGWEFISSQEDIGNSGFFVTGGAMYVVAAPHTTITFLPDTSLAANFVTGSQFYVKGYAYANRLA
jgi:hypothetical protein